MNTAEYSADGSLKEQIEQLARCIENARDEIAAIGNIDSKPIGAATMQLDAVLKGTEEASLAIMDAADNIQSIANSLKGDGKAKLEEAVTKIYEACTFQDLTGQRVTKVIKTLSDIDTRIHNILELFDNTGGAQVITAPMVNKAEKALLNGPQLPGEAPSQADIDSLFRSVS